MDHLRICRNKEDVEVANRSREWAALTLNGTRARKTLATCSNAGLSNAGFRWLSAQQIEINGHRLWALRMPYSGELGWKLRGPHDGIWAAYEAIWAAGETGTQLDVLIAGDPRSALVQGAPAYDSVNIKPRTNQ